MGQRQWVSPAAKKTLGLLSEFRIVHFGEELRCAPKSDLFGNIRRHGTVLVYFLELDEAPANLRSILESGRSQLIKGGGTGYLRSQARRLRVLERGDDYRSSQEIRLTFSGSLWPAEVTEGQPGLAGALVIIDLEQLEPAELQRKEQSLGRSHGDLLSILPSQLDLSRSFRFMPSDPALLVMPPEDGNDRRDRPRPIPRGDADGEGEYAFQS